LRFSRLAVEVFRAVSFHSNCRLKIKEELIKWISETLSFFVWQGARSFCRGAGLFRPAPLQKERATQSKRNKSTFP
jgi:hypothetical protein